MQVKELRRQAQMGRAAVSDGICSMMAYYIRPWEKRRSNWQTMELHQRRRKPLSPTHTRLQMEMFLFLSAAPTKCRIYICYDNPELMKLIISRLLEYENWQLIFLTITIMDLINAEAKWIDCNIGKAQLSNVRDERLALGSTMARNTFIYSLQKYYTLYTLTSTSCNKNIGPIFNGKTWAKHATSENKLKIQ